MRDVMELETPEQITAFGHPLRQRILRLLSTDPMTNKQLAQKLGESPARLHFHVRELHRAGLIELVAERPKGGVLEKYYRATARAFRLGRTFGVMTDRDTVPEATLEAASQEWTRAREHVGPSLRVTRLLHEQAVLSPERLARVTSHLDAIAEEFRAATEADAEGQPMLLTGLLHPLAQDAHSRDSR